MPDDLMPVELPPPSVVHLDEPQWWSVVRPDGIQIDRVPDVTAATIVDGWLILWRYALIVGFFSPGTWGGVSVCQPPAYKRFTY